MYIVRARYDIRDVRIVGYTLNTVNVGTGYCGLLFYLPHC